MTHAYGGAHDRLSASIRELCLANPGHHLELPKPSPNLFSHCRVPMTNFPWLTAGVVGHMLAQVLAAGKLPDLSADSTCSVSEQTWLRGFGWHAFW